MSRKRLLRFDIDKYDYDDFENWQSDGSYHWEMALRSVKKRIGELGLPMALFHNVGCLAEKASLEQGRFVISGACVHIDDSFSHDGCQYHILPAGLYITAYCDGSRDTPSFSQEAALVRRMLEEIRRSGWEIAGDYYGDVMADTPAFLYQGRENFMRLTIPIRIPRSGDCGKTK